MLGGARSSSLTVQSGTWLPTDSRNQVLVRDDGNSEEVGTTEMRVVTAYVQTVG